MSIGVNLAWLFAFVALAFILDFILIIVKVFIIVRCSIR